MERPLEKIKKFEGGHTFFRIPGDYRLYIADDSGPVPSETDDGVLFIDPSRPIECYEIREAPGNSWSLPVLDEKGEKSSTIGGLYEALWVADLLRMRIGLPGEGQREVVFRVFPPDDPGGTQCCRRREKVPT